MKVSRRMLAAVCALCMAFTLMPLQTLAQTTNLPDIIITDFTAANPPAWSGGNLTLADAPEGSGVSGKLGMLETKESDNKQGNLTISSTDNDWSDYGIDAAGTEAPNAAGCGYFNMWVYSPEIKSNARGSSGFAVMIVTNTREGDTFEPTTTRRLQSGVNQDFEGWKLISIPMVDYPENGDGKPVEKFERRNLSHAPTWSSIKQVQFAVSSIGGCNPIAGNKLYFSKIWISKEKPGGEYTGEVTSSVANNPGLSNDVFVDYNTSAITFTAEENLLGYLGDASLEVMRYGGDYSAVDKSEYSMSVSGDTVTISFDSGLSSHRGYRVKLADMHTESYKTFSQTVEFKTTGYGQVALPTSQTVANNDAQVELDQEIAFVFDEDVWQSTGTLKVEVSSDGESYDEVWGAALSASGTKLSVVLGESLLPRRKYRVTVDDAYVGAALGNFSTLIEFTTLGYGQSVTAASQSVSNNAKDIEPTQTVSFTFDEALIDGSGSVKVEKASASGSYSTVQGTSLVFGASTVSVNYGAALSPRSRYRITLTDVYTQSYKSFSTVLEFTTIGIDGVHRNDMIQVVSDFYDGTEVWKGGNMTAKQITVAGYDGHLGLLKSYGEGENYSITQGRMTFGDEVNKDWSNVKSVNLLLYAPKSVPTSKFAFIVMTKRSDGGSAETYYQTTLAVDFAGWKVVNIPIENFIPRNPGEPDWSQVTGLMAATRGYGSANLVPDTEVYFKEVWIAKDGANTLRDVNLKDGEMDVAPSSMSYTQEYDSVIHNAPYAATAKFVNGSNEIAANVSISGGIVSVSPKSDLAKGTDYTLSLGGLYFENGKALPERTISFTTTSEDVYASSPVITEDGEGNVNVKISVSNNTTNTVNTRIVARLLTVEGIEADVKEISSAIVATNASVEKVLTFTDVVSSLTAKGTENVLNYKVEAYVISKADNTPIIRRVRKYPDNTLEVQADSALSQSNISVNAKIRDMNLEISGNCSTEGARSVFIAVLDGETEKYSNMTQTNAGGALSVTYDMQGIIEEGKTYTVCAYPFMGSTASDTFYSATTAEKNTIKASINAAASAADVETLLSVQTNRDALGIKSADTKNTALVLFEQKEYASFAEIAQTAETAERILAEVNAVNWANMAEYLAANKSVIMGATDFESTFFAKTPEEQNTICSDLVKDANYPFNNFGELRDALTALTSGGTTGTQGGTEGSSGDTSGGDTGYGSGLGNGGSGGGGGGGSTAKDPEPEKAPMPDSTQPSDGTYNDLGSHAWAKSAIEELSRKGIVSGDGNGNFRPQDSVKREEFVKMLIEALDIKTDVKKDTFTDSQSGAWYEKYLSAAKHSGIVLGREDGSFGIGESILRQDLAVMMLRALRSVGKAPEVSDGRESFSDEDAISDYAKEAVENMHSNGFVQGMGDGSFAPHQSATRAQAAVIIKRILDYIGGSDTLL